MMSTIYNRILANTDLQMPNDWLHIHTIDMHTGGEPLRVIVSGFPKLKGNSVLDYRRDCKDHYDHLRTALMHEPRGHADMYGCILVPPNDEDGDFGIIFIHNEGYSTMCGHATIAISTLAAQMNWIDTTEGENLIKIDAPCGRLHSYVDIKDGQVEGVRFHCVPSFVAGLDHAVQIDGMGTVKYDLAYGGAFYAFVDLSKNNLNLALDKTNYNRIIDLAMQIKHAVIAHDQKIHHPLEGELSFLYGTIFIDSKPTANADSKNVCVFADGEVDRCPTGSGVSGRMAIHYKRGEIGIGEKMKIESITGSIFEGEVIREIAYDPYTAVIPQVKGTAHVTGKHTFIIDPKDPMKDGFFLR